MEPKPLPIRGRGAADNPGNRFERLAYEPDPDAEPDEAPAPATQFFRDASRSIIATNDSPDVAFDASINPYRGCEHGCVYCMDGATPILMADGRVRLLKDLSVGDRVYGTGRDGWYRTYQKTEVLAHWRVRKTAYRVNLEDGTELIAGADHRFLTERGWKYVAPVDAGAGQRPHLTPNNKLMGVGALATGSEKTRDYQVGYLCGIIRGDALLASYHYPDRRAGGGKSQHQFRLALADQDALRRAAAYLADCGIATHAFAFQEASPNRRAMQAIRTSRRAYVTDVRALIAWPSSEASVGWNEGFLAGIFDAEGSYSCGILRICNTDMALIDRVQQSLQRLGFAAAVEAPRKGVNRPVHVVRLCGGLREHLRFFHTVDPAITRKRDIEGQAVKNTAKLRVRTVEPLGPRLLFDITTGTGDFIANGVVSHNCYARPTHEYLGLSAGLDFETRIFVKEDAPRLLRKELMAPRWQPQVLGISGVTDCYQPIERRLQLTRRCLEVLAEFRNPVALITKSKLVTRDIDVLAGMARDNIAAVFLSVTTLDAELAGKLEPRAARPGARLEAIAALSAAGIPVGVLAAPVIPGLNDHELPAILQAAAAAGARYAGYQLLRLPLGVGPLFEDWLAQHYPECADKVLGRIRELRGGKLNSAQFGDRMRGQGPMADAIKRMFELGRKQAGIVGRAPSLVTDGFRRPGQQRSLFD